MTHNYSNKIQRLLMVLLALLLGTPLMMASFATQALAQDTEEDEFLLEDIVVTGSRIARRDYESNSPIVTIKAEQFEQQTGLNIESYLNQLPEYNPAASPVTSQGDV